MIVTNVGDQRRIVVGVCQTTATGERRRVTRIVQAAGGGAYRVAELDPYRDNVVLCLEGSAVDLSPRPLTLTSVGGAAFADGVASGLSPGKYFAVAGDFTLSGDFTLECRMKSDGTDRYYSNIVCGENWADTDTAWFSIVGTTTRRPYLRRRDNVLLGGETASSLTTAFREIALVRYNNIIRAYIDGLLSGAGVIDAAPLHFGTGGKLWIGAAPAGQADAQAVSFARLRITKGIARYTGNYTPPGHYIDIAAEEE